MNQEQRSGEPILVPIKNGWAAHGDGWAVHGRTQEEAVVKFREAEQRHQEIDARPIWFDRSSAESSMQEPL